MAVIIRTLWSHQNRPQLLPAGLASYLLVRASSTSAQCCHRSMKDTSGGRALDNEGFLVQQGIASVYQALEAFRTRAPHNVPLLPPLLGNFFTGHLSLSQCICRNEMGSALCTTSLDNLDKFNRLKPVQFNPGDACERPIA